MRKVPTDLREEYEMFQHLMYLCLTVIIITFHCKKKLQQDNAVKLVRKLTGIL